MKARSLSIATGVLSASALVAFALFAREAERAMDKSGFGDQPRYFQFSTYAGIAFWLAAGAWLACVVFSQMSPKPYRGRALFGFGLLMPIGAALTWLLGALGA